jgi:4-azaleucine resistance transporter AzlC
MQQTFTRRSEFLAGIRDTLPMDIGAIPFGIIFGALAVNSGISPLGTLGLSLFVFAGSSQFIATGLVAQNVSVFIIIVTTFIVNLRHALYSATLAPHLKGLSHKWLLPLGFWLTDETFAVVVNRYNKDDKSPYKHWYHLGSSVIMYANWNACTIIGLVAGQSIPDMRSWGLDFAMAVTFIGLLVPNLKNRPMLLAAMIAGVSAVLFYNLPNKLGLMIAALLGITAGVITEKAIEPQRRQHPGDIRTPAR